MYGFPTQTAQETIDALDVVRQLFKYGLVTSASWAKFGVTPHSPIGRNPDEFKITLQAVPQKAFIEQILVHDDPANDHEKFTKGLMQAVRFYGLGLHTELPSESWFDFEVPYVSIDRDLIGKVLTERARMLASPPADLRRDKRVVWLGTPPSFRIIAANGPASSVRELEAELVVHGAQGDEIIKMNSKRAAWLAEMMGKARPESGGPLALSELEATYESTGAAIAGTDADPHHAFDQLLRSEVWETLCKHGLVGTDELRWTRPQPAIRFLPLDGGQPRAELALAPEEKDSEEPPVLVQMPARWATWLAEVLAVARWQPKPVKELARSFREAVAQSQAQKPKAAAALDELIASETWRALRDKGLAIL
jgi:hypothetical protein